MGNIFIKFLTKSVDKLYFQGMPNKFVRMFRENSEEISVWTPARIFGKIPDWIIQSNNARISKEIHAGFFGIFGHNRVGRFNGIPKVNPQQFLKKYLDNVLGISIKKSLKDFLKWSLWKILRESLEKFPMNFLNAFLEEFLK